MELKLGKMSNKELAEWFGISVGSFKNRRKDKLEELKGYANFNIVYGGVEIKEIYENEFNKSRKSNYVKIRDKIDEKWNDNGLDTCKNVSKKIIKDIGNELALADSTVYVYTRQGRDELYGKPYGISGKIGNCVYILCKSTENGLEFFTEEEKKKKDMLIRKYYGDTTERMIILDAMVLAGDLKKEDYYDTLHELDQMNNTTKYMEFLAELQTELGCKIVKGTYKENYAIE